jgi:hypothetical protein
MRGHNKLTIALFIILVLTIFTSVRALWIQDQNPTGQGKQNAPANEKDEHFKSRFPVIDYHAPEDTDINKQRIRKEKNKRYDRFGFVRKNPSMDVTETVFYTDWYGGKPALPVNESSAIIIGLVMGSEAHLSNDRSGIYTEFIVEVKEVLKGDSSNLALGSKISVDRPGGYVRYPSGYKRLYRYSGMNMPDVGRQYIFFLTNPAQDQNYGLLTGYELTHQGITPLDSIPTFKALQGIKVAALLEQVRDPARRPQQ